MEKEYQRHHRDCLQCTLATLLSVPYESIPEFYKTIADMNSPTKEEAEAFERQYWDWLKSNGYVVIEVKAKYVEGGTIEVPFVSLDEYFCLGTLKKEHRNFSHSVVLRVTNNNNIELYHDPKRNSDYDIRDLISIDFIFRINAIVEESTPGSGS